MKNDKLPLADHVLRYASSTRLQFDDEENAIALLPQALSLKAGESYLSVTWVEHFAGDASQQVVQAVRAFRASMDQPLGKRSAFGLATVGAIINCCSSHKHPATVRILHEPQDRNQAHSGIHGFPRDDQDLLESLASEVFSTILLNKDVSENDD